MNVRRTSTILWTTAAALAAVAVVALVVGLAAPLDTGDEASDPGSNANSTLRLSATARRLPAPELFDAAAGMNWRTGQPVALQVVQPPPPESVQPVAPPVVVEVPRPTMPSIALDGTVGRTLAIVRTASGGTEIKRAGESVDGVEIVEIEAGRVRVKFNGEERTIEKPRPAGDVTIGG